MYCLSVLKTLHRLLQRKQQIALFGWAHVYGKIVLNPYVNLLQMQIKIF